MKKNLFSKYAAMLITLFVFSQCVKEQNSVIPFYPVNIYIYTTDPQFINLSYVGGWEYINGGSRGIIVFRKSNDEFNAFDRHTPIDVEKSCAVLDVDSSGIYAIDRCSSAKFSLFDGQVISGKAAYPLHQYRTTYDGQVLSIFN
jgi:hypothetical protein